MITLNANIKQAFRALLAQYHASLSQPRLQDELDYIRRTVDFFDNIPLLVGGSQSVRTRSASIHGTPLAEFVACTYAFHRLRIEKEIADIVLVYKHFTNGNMDAYRASLIQAKFSRNVRKISWSGVDAGQFCLLSSWPTFLITSPLRFFKQYSLTPRNLTWSTYGLVGPDIIHQPIFYSADRMLRQLGAFPQDEKFLFVATPTRFDFSQSYFLKFIQALIGEDLLTNSPVRNFIIDLYKIVDLEPDPPGEFERVGTDRIKKQPFGVVEFTVSDEG